MNKKIFSRLTIFGMAFALVLALGTLNAAKAAPGVYGTFTSQDKLEGNVRGSDEACNSNSTRNADYDRGRIIPWSEYGMLGTSQQ
jgi:hypothetical protein